MNAIEYILENTGISVEKIGHNRYRSHLKKTRYAWLDQWTKNLEERLGVIQYVTDKNGHQVFNLLNNRTTEEAKVIRKALRIISNRAGSYPLSVRTDSGWIKIRPMNSGRRFNPMESFILKELGLNGHSNVELIAPGDTKDFVKKALKIVGEDHF